MGSRRKGYDADAEQYADSKLGAGPGRQATGDLLGELTNTDVYVKTRQKEFDYPQGRPTASLRTKATAHPAGRYMRAY